MLQRNGHSDTDLVQAVRRAASQASTPSIRRRSADHDVGHHSRASTGHRSSARSSYSHRSSSVGMSLQEMQAHVQNEAMDRYINSLQKEATESVRNKATWDSTVKGGMDEEKDELQRKREMCKKNALQLREQMEENKVRRADVRKGFIEAASAHSFPLFTETFISEDEVEAYRKRQKEIFREELDQQIVTLSAMKNLALKKDRDFAEQSRTANISNMSRARGVARERLVRQGNEMVNSWDRDVRLKSLKKAIHNGRDVAQDLHSASMDRFS